MSKLYISIILLVLLTKPGFSQTETKSFGKVDISELELKECDFEKDANAMVLFDKADVFFSSAFQIVMVRHKRIKIFNDKAKDAANIRLEYYGGNRFESIAKVQAQTINLVNGKAEIIKLDKKSLYNETLDKSRNAIAFSLPNVQAGSVIEFKYEWSTDSWGNFPDWFFQGELPVRYSEYKTAIPDMFFYKIQYKTRQPFVKNTTTSQSKSLGGGSDAGMYADVINTKALSNIPTLNDEPYMSSRRDNLQGLIFELQSIKPIGEYTNALVDTWAKVGGYIADDEDFGGQLNQKLEGEDVILSKAKEIKSAEGKIAYIFNEVKNAMKWNDIDRWFTNEGTAKAWQKKTGNSTEINLILTHLLKKADITVFPMIVSTREHGKVRMEHPSLMPFNRTIAFVRVSETKNYFLDATSKFQSYTSIPTQLLNSNGLYIDKENKRFQIVFIGSEEPVRNLISINAAIKPDGKMEGTAKMTNYNYVKENCIRQYKTNGEEKYKVFLKNNDNKLTISSVKLDNMENDTLPLIQDVTFHLDLPASDENYIYFNANLLSPLKDNPFLSEKRATDIDFGQKNSYLISGAYAVPPGFKVDALPKNISMVTPDKGISFKRIASEQEGVIHLRYTVDFKKTYYFKEDYPDFREFFKQMSEMLNEQIVLKKL
ncbi:MAG: DUF3857 domain-containing protein [Sphingobacteriaceae bacterium]